MPRTLKQLESRKKALEHEASILEKQIELKKHAREQVDTSIAESQKSWRKAEGVHLQRLEQTKEETARLSKSLLALEDRQKTLEDNRSSLQRHRSVLKKELEGIKTYRNEQQRLTDEAIADMNNRIIEFRTEGERAVQQKAQFDLQILEAEKEKAQAESQMVDSKVRLGKLTELYELKRQEYHDGLTSLQSLIETKRGEVRHIDRLRERRMQEVMTRENALRIKEEAAREIAKELTKKEKFLNMSYKLRGVEISPGM